MKNEKNNLRRIEGKTAFEDKSKRRMKLTIIISFIALAILSALIFIEARVESGSIDVEFTTQVLDNENSTQGENILVAGKNALLTFKLKDNRTGKPVSELSPDISFYIPGEHDETREHKHADGYHLTGGELNMAKLQLFVLNSERGTIEVLDTLGGYDPRPKAIKNMGTMTSKVIRLKGSAADLLGGRYGDYLYATLPGEGQVAAVNTISHEVVKYIDAGNTPGQMFLQPGSKYLWVSSSNGTSIIDTERNTLVKTIETGKGHHEIAFSPENAYITNSQYSTVSVIRLADLKKLEDINVEMAPYGIDYSNVSHEIYVANSLSGTLSVIGEGTGSIKKHIQMSRGIEIIKFSPDGKRGVVLNKYENSAYVIDAATGSIIKTVKTGEMPSSVAFMDEYALIRNTYSNDLTYISMLDPGVSNNELVGTQPPLNATQRSLQTTSYGDEVVVTSPRDGGIYFMHKMNGQPMVMSSTRVEFGSDAVAIIENKLHETGPGVYQQYILLEREGVYVIEFRTSNLNTTFKIEVLPDRTIGFQTTLFNKTSIKGIPTVLQYRITERKTGQPEENLTDLVFIVIKPGKGAWTKRLPSKYIGNGIYEAKMTFPEEGEYMVTLASSRLSSRGYEIEYDYIMVNAGFPRGT